MVVGAGPGGEAVASGAAAAGLQVAVVERRLVGGECPYFGCVPTKMMVRGSDALAEARRLGEVGGEADVAPDWSVVARRVREDATTDWDDAAAVRRLEDAGVHVLKGHGRLDGPRRVLVDAEGRERVAVAARRGVLLDPGTRPAVPPVSGLAGTPYWTNRDAVRATEVPGASSSWAAGRSAASWRRSSRASASRVTVLDRGPRLLPRDEPEAGELLGEVFAEEGIEVLHRAELREARHDEDGFRLRVGIGGGDASSGSPGEERELRSAALLVATGRTPNLDDLGLDTVGLDASARHLEVDERMRAADGLWAIGDVVGHGRVHPRLDLPGRRRPARRHRRAGGGRGLPGRAARDLHRPRGRRRRADAGAARRGRRARAHGHRGHGVLLARVHARAGGARAGHGRGRRRPRRARRRHGRRAERGRGARASWRSRSTPRCRSRRCGAWSGPTRPSTGRSRRRWPTSTPRATPGDGSGSG